MPNFFGKCFLGNTGSYTVAILISFFYMQLYKKGIVEYSDIILIFIIPFIDGLRVTFTRIINKQNPFSGDFSHLHHLVRNKSKSIIILYFIIFLPSSINFFIKDYSFFLSVSSVLLYFFFLL